MSSERVFWLDKAAIELFALKGMQFGHGPEWGNGVGVKVRRVMQLVRDFSRKPFDQLRILDLACGEGVYAIEAALRGAEVRALDARTERMDEGAKVAERLGLKNLSFEQTDIRDVSIRSHGKADVILLLGILYHLDQRDLFPVLENIYDMCDHFIIMDTHIALQSQIRIERDGRSYDGLEYREHADDDPDVVRRSRLLASLDNPLSFWFTGESLLRALHDVGFTSVCQCEVPFEPFKSEGRITLIASKGEPVKVSTYPWINNRTEDEIRRSLSEASYPTDEQSPQVVGGPQPPASHLSQTHAPELSELAMSPTGPAARQCEGGEHKCSLWHGGWGSARQRLGQFTHHVVKGTLRRLGLEIRRI